MNKLTITEAARIINISRTTFYKDIDEKSVSFELNEKGKKIFNPADKGWRRLTSPAASQEWA